MTAKGSEGPQYRWQDSCLPGSSAAVVGPAAESNKGPILDVLQQYLGGLEGGRVLEVASGTGQHAAHLARALPRLAWQPTDATAELFASVAAHCAGLGNVAPPVVLDASWPFGRWEEALGPGARGGYDAVFASNLTHIAPWAVTEGLVAGAAAALRPGGLLCVYGPFKLRGRFTTDSNRAFNDRLVASNPEWGYRDTDAIEALGRSQGLEPAALHDMPANNFLVVMRAAGAAAAAAAAAGERPA